MHQEERATGGRRHRADVLPGLVEGGDGAAHGHAAVPRDLRRHPADPSDVGLAVLPAEGEAGGQVPAYDVAVQAGDGALALLEQCVDHRLGDRRLAAAGQAGEEQDETLLGGTGPVGLDDGGDVLGVLAVAVAEGQHRVRAGVRRDHLHPEVVVGRRVVVGRQRYRDHGRGRKPACGGQGGAQQGDRGELRRAGTGQRQQHDRAVQPAQPLDLLFGERVHDRDEGRAGVGLADLLGRQVEAAEGPVLGVREGLDLAAGGEPRQGQALGVDQLHLLAHEVGRQVEGHRRPGLVERGRGGQRPSGEQLEVGQLPWGRAVLGRRHGTILPASLP